MGNIRGYRAVCRQVVGNIHVALGNRWPAPRNGPCSRPLQGRPLVVGCSSMGLPRNHGIFGANHGKSRKIQENLEKSEKIHKKSRKKWKNH